MFALNKYKKKWSEVFWVSYFIC